MKLCRLLKSLTYIKKYKDGKRERQRERDDINQNVPYDSSD
jgi:hypothetical protein